MSAACKAILLVLLVDGLLPCSRGQSAERVQQGRKPNPLEADRNQFQASVARIDKAIAAISGRTLDPIEVIRTANHLRALGKERALAAIDEYIRSCRFPGAPDELLCILYALFEVPTERGVLIIPISNLGVVELVVEPGHMPRPPCWMILPPTPTDPKLIPTLPLLIVEDLPLYVPMMSILNGNHPGMGPYAGYFRKHGRIRNKPLIPPQNPLALLEPLRASKQWIYGGNADPGNDGLGLIHIMKQLERAIHSVYRPQIDWRDWCKRDTEYLLKEWQRLTKEFAALEVLWDPAVGDYTFKDGSRLPQKERK